MIWMWKQMPDNFLTSFVHSFFTANQCAVNELEQGVFQVQLTEELDKALMNRPFYWQYMTSMGKKGIPMELTLITEPQKRKQKGEWIQYGTRRLRQMEHYLQEQAQYTVLYQSIHTTKKVMLQPWLVINYQLTFTGKHRKEKILSFGLNLINGMMTMNMMELLDDMSLQQTISNQCYTVSPLITMPSGMLRIEKQVVLFLEQQDDTWAEESIELLQEEVTILEHFYQDAQDENEKKNEIDSVTERLTPTIQHKVISGALVYLKDGMFM